MNKFCLEKGIEFQLNIKNDPVIAGDKTWLRQLFRNLIDNGIRYTSAKGRITVSLKQEQQMAVMSVSDTGVGRPADEIPHIFERFYRVDKAP